MSQAIHAYYAITASPEFREIERLRDKARHDEAQALRNAEQRGREAGKLEGWQEGRQEGRQEGMSERSIVIARAMILEGEPVDKIMRYTGLTRKEIESMI